jgi:hypothetical protein
MLAVKQCNRAAVHTYVGMVHATRSKCLRTANNASVISLQQANPR